MNNNKGYTPILVIIVLIAIIGIVLGVYFLFFNTPSSSSPSSDSSVETTAPSSVKKYDNPTSGISFDYPQDLILKVEHYSETTGEWTGSFTSDKGDIDIIVSKNLPVISETRMQNRVMKIANKDVTLFMVKRDTCEIGIAQTILDADYDMRFSFESCAQPIATHLKDPKTIVTALNTLDTIISTITLTK